MTSCQIANSYHVYTNDQPATVHHTNIW